jgi:hypothetical protein
MTDLMKKLNWKGHTPVALLHTPLSFAAECAALAAEAEVHNQPQAGVAYPFGLTFAVDLAELALRAPELVAATTTDAILWFAYPKQTSKNYNSDLNRDLCWKFLEPFGLEPNRQVAIDDDWSAMRYKKV